MGTAVDEADESAGWLAMAKGLEIGDRQWRDALIQEAGELLAIFAQSYNTAARNHRYSVDHGRLKRRRTKAAVPSADRPVGP
jgi:hypothetical protein